MKIELRPVDDSNSSDCISLCGILTGICHQDFEAPLEAWMIQVRFL